MRLFYLHLSINRLLNTIIFVSTISVSWLYIAHSRGWYQSQSFSAWSVAGQRLQRRPSCKSCCRGPETDVRFCMEFLQSRSLVNNVCLGCYVRAIQGGQKIQYKVYQKTFLQFHPGLPSASNPLKTRCFPWGELAPWILIPSALLKSSSVVHSALQNTQTFRYM